MRRSILCGAELTSRPSRTNTQVPARPRDQEVTANHTFGVRLRVSSSHNRLSIKPTSPPAGQNPRWGDIFPAMLREAPLNSIASSRISYAAGRSPRATRRPRASVERFVANSPRSACRTRRRGDAGRSIRTAPARRLSPHTARREQRGKADPAALSGQSQSLERCLAETRRDVSRIRVECAGLQAAT